MNLELDDKPKATSGCPLIDGKIPVRNVWLLFLYAYDLARFQDRFEAEVEESPDLKSLIARLLCHAVEVRLRRHLSFGYRRREATLKRVRGRIDILETQSKDLFRRGEVACRFEEFTINTPRNRLVRAALSRLAPLLSDRELSNKDLAHRARQLAGALERCGVSGGMPSREEISADQIARHEAEDKLMVSLARAVFDLVLPTETAGQRALYSADREDAHFFRRLFEKAIGNFFKVELPRSEGWRVLPGKRIAWPIESGTNGIGTYLPNMITDIVLENDIEGRRIIIDTKFTNILTQGRYDNRSFKSGHIYQIYAYLRSQEHVDDPMSQSSEGILLYPAIGLAVNEVALIQGHLMRFATVDLTASSSQIIARLRALVEPPVGTC
jgi:5-methylcytosine-specific restriction enzyme subunit McrC